MGSQCRASRWHRSLCERHERRRTLEYARMNNLQIAIRCGGLVVDLFCYFNYAVVDPEKRTVRMGAGTLWATVEKEVIQYGLASVAGTVNHVRVDLLMTCTSCQY